MVSHDLRNPLTTILGYTQLLQTGKLNPVKASHALNTITHSVKLQRQLIEDLLDISRITSGSLRLDLHPVNLVSVIEAAIDTVRLAAEAKASSSSQPLPSTVWVQGDVNRLQQVVWNLLSNAIKFTPASGQVQIQLEQMNNQAQVTVSDTGRGIPAELLPYIFERFRQGDSMRQDGLGLGLAIVRYLVELHGGTVQGSSPGEGQEPRLRSGYR